MNTTAQDQIENLKYLADERRSFRSWNKRQIRQYVSEWNLDTSWNTLAAIEYSLEQREESAVYKLAEALGVSVEEANKYVIENI